jgi:ABC-type branched-subunit amino acid transport system substrate-binding protein
MINRRNILCSSVLLTAATYFPLTSFAQATPGVSATEIRLGAFTALTGFAAPLAVPVYQGADAYYKMLNDAGGIDGRKIKLLVEDNGFNAEKSVAAARKLVGSDDVLAIVHAFGTGPGAATFPYLLEQARVPYLLPSAGIAAWFNPPRPGLLSAQNILDNAASALGRWTAKDGHKVVVFVNGDPNPVPAELARQKYMEVMPNGVFHKIDAKMGSLDYAPMALEISRLKPTAVIGYTSQNDNAALSTQLRNQGLEVPVYVSATNVMQTMFDMVDADVAKRFKAVSYTTSLQSPTPAVKEYRDAMSKYYPRSKLDYASFTGFAYARIMAEALRRADKPLTRESLVKAFYKLSNYDSGIVPPVTFSPTRHLGTTTMYRLVAKDGNWVVLGDPIDTATNW